MEVLIFNFILILNLFYVEPSYSLKILYIFFKTFNYEIWVVELY